MSSTKIQWRVQVRKSRVHKWVNKGLFETRDDARATARHLRWDFEFDELVREGFGFGNTRVVRYEKGAK